MLSDLVTTLFDSYDPDFPKKSTEGSESNRMAAKSTIITLENFEDWDQWWRALKASILEEIWPRADPEQPASRPMVPPTWPRIQDIAPLAVAYVALSSAQQRTYDCQGSGGSILKLKNS